MQYKAIVCMAVVFSLAGCSSKGGVEQGTSVITKAQSCMDEIVGDFKLVDWCEALPGSQQLSCSCDRSELVEVKDAFGRMVTMERTPEDLLNWYRVLPEHWPVTRVVAWVASGIPLDEVRDWKKLGYPVERLSAIHDLGISLADIRVMIEKRLTIEEMEEWSATDLPMETWWVWRADGVKPHSAQQLTKLYALNSVEAIAKFLKQKRFVPISEDQEPRSWICSRGNQVAELIRVTGASAEYIVRLVLVDAEGYDLPAMSLFGNEIPGQLVKRVERGESSNERWSTCFGPALERIYQS